MATARGFTAELSAGLGGPEWIRQRRAEMFGKFAASSMPSQSEEIWRYSRIDDLDLDAFSTVPELVAGVDPPSLPYDAAFDGTAGLIWCQNGQLTDANLFAPLIAKGVIAASVGTSFSSSDHLVTDGANTCAKERLGTIAAGDDALAYLAGAFVHDVVVVEIPDGVVVDEPIVVVHWVVGAADKGLGSRAVFPRLLVVAGEGSRATVVEITASPTWGPPGASLLVVPITELSVGDNAQLDFVSVQDLGPHDWQVAYQASMVGRDARFNSFTAALGGDYARVRTESHAVSPGSETRLFAAYFGTGTQMHDFRTLQDHQAPHTKSDLYFKGAVGDHASSVYSGLIRVAKGAVRSVAFQQNRNLVLSEGAHAESVPNLEIEENDVRCSHASAVGPVDADQRYYLESRGVPPEEAEQLVVEGFFDDIVGRSPDVPGVKALIRRKVAAKLREQF